MIRRVLLPEIRQIWKKQSKSSKRYYRATVLLRTLLIMIKNGCSYDKLQERLSGLPFKNKELEEETRQAVGQLFESVPVFEYKGYSREEYKRLSHQKQIFQVCPELFLLRLV